MGNWRPVDEKRGKSYCNLYFYPCPYFTSFVLFYVLFTFFLIILFLLLLAIARRCVISSKLLIDLSIDVVIE
jgi:hypothetical protein